MEATTATTTTAAGPMGAAAAPMDKPKRSNRVVTFFMCLMFLAVMGTLLDQKNEPEPRVYGGSGNLHILNSYSQPVQQPPAYLLENHPHHHGNKKVHNVMSAAAQREAGDGQQFSLEAKLLELAADDDAHNEMLPDGDAPEEQRELYYGGTGYGGSSCTGNCGGTKFTTLALYGSTNACQAMSYTCAFYPFANKYNMVHVIHTKFMQHQPDLYYLGHARMELLRTFTIPSIRQQSSQQFLWIIWTDPKLVPELKCELLEAVRGIPNVVVLGYGKRVTEDFRSFDVRKKISTKRHIWYGDKDTLKIWSEAAEGRILLETRLDADDALNVDFVKRVQKQAKKTIQQSRDEEDYIIWCSEKHLEWRYFNDDVTDEEAEEHGKVIDWLEPDFCVTPGLTTAFHVRTTVDHLATVNQCKMHKEVARCDEKNPHRCLARIDMGSHCTQNCYVSLRPRTPCAAGMQHVMPNYQFPVVPSISQAQGWGAVSSCFGVDPYQIYAMRARMQLNMDYILQDAYRGQCTQGHSCNPRSQHSLEYLMQNSGQNFYYN